MRRADRRPAALIALCVLATLCGGAQGHGEAEDALPPEAGLRLQAEAALRVLHTHQPLPSTRLAGVLLRGDAGRDPEGAQLEHGSVSAAWRWHPQWGARLALGAHGRDPVEVEAAWLQWRLDVSTRDDHNPDHDPGARPSLATQAWLLSAGRQSPALGPVLQPEGQIGPWALLPLAQRAAFDHAGSDDGLQGGWRGGAGTTELALDLGLWRGLSFPGAPRGGHHGPGLSLHAGLQWSGLSANLVALQVRPRARGASTGPALGHTHRAPECDPAFTEVICFDGRARVLGGSLRWRGEDSPLAWPLTLALAGWWRQDDGQLASADGLARYRGRTQGGWLDLAWQLRPGWTLAWRHELLQARHHLQGAGAGLLAQQARLQHAQPLRRNSLQLAWQALPQARLSLQLGHEQRAGQRFGFAALRLVWRGLWEPKGD